jgi:hypothetical protein
MEVFINHSPVETDAATTLAELLMQEGIAADGIIDLIPHAVELFAEGFDLVGGGVLFQYDNHGGILLSFLLLLSYTQMFLSMPIF